MLQFLLVDIIDLNSIHHQVLYNRLLLLLIILSFSFIRIHFDISIYLYSIFYKNTKLFLIIYM